MQGEGQAQRRAARQPETSRQQAAAISCSAMRPLQMLLYAIAQRSALLLGAV
jgi:hypothetical protein